MPASQLSLEDLQKSTPEIMRFSIVELLFLLKFARHELSFIYKQRHTFIQALKQGENQFEVGEQYTFKEYEFYTLKCFVLENLTRERIGYIPSKLTEIYIQNLARKMDESTIKQMVINNSNLIQNRKSFR